MRWSAIIVAAGRGTRFGQPKQLLPIVGSPMIAWSVRVFAALADVDEIVIATERDWLEDVRTAANENASGKPCIVCEGGASRQGSVAAALSRIAKTSEAALVHDGARPLLTESDARRVMEPVRPGHASLLAVPVIDTLKLAKNGIVEQTLPRESLWAAQTPQCAMITDLLRAHENALTAGITSATDDAALLEREGFMVHVVPGSPENFKVTIAQDLERANDILRKRMAPAT